MDKFIVVNRISIAFLIAGGIAILLMGCNSSSEHIERNIRNSQKLKVGMTLNEALLIMGDPDTVKTYKGHPKYKGIITTYYYETTFDASDWIHFRVDSTNQVVEVNPFEIKKQ